MLDSPELCVGGWLMRVAVYLCVGLLQVAGWLRMYQEVRKSTRVCAI